MRRGLPRRFRGQSGAGGGPALLPRCNEQTSSSGSPPGPPIVADGGMGAVLASAVPGLRCPEEANLRAPESVVDVHLGYIRAGAELIETNTFGANRPKLAQHFLEEEFEHDQQRRREACARGARGLGPRRLHRRLDRAARRRRAARPRAVRRSMRSRRGSSRAAASTSSWSRRSSTPTTSRRRCARCAPCRSCRSSR